MKLEQKIKKVNELLLKREPESISQDSLKGEIGYGIQYVIDAMNEVFGVDGWNHKADDGQIFSHKTKSVMVMRVKVTFFVKLTDGQWAGLEADGQADIVKNNVGDAKKSARADGLKKALSYASIGNRAYLGYLKGTEVPVTEVIPDIKCEKCEVERLTKAEAEFSTQVYGKILGRDCQEKLNKKNGKRLRKK